MVARSEARPKLAEGLREIYRRTGLVPVEPGQDAGLYTVSGPCITSAWPLLAILADREGLAAAVAFTAGDEATALDRMAGALGLHPDYVRGFTEGYFAATPDLTAEEMFYGFMGCAIDEPAEVDLYESGLGWAEGLNAGITVRCSPSLFGSRTR
jgi:hypothetical protein